MQVDRRVGETDSQELASDLSHHSDNQGKQ